MKLIVVFCAFGAIVSAQWKPRTREQFYQFREECFKEEKVSETAMGMIKKHQFSQEPEALCYVRCIGKKSGTWDDTKGYDVERVYETFKNANMEVNKEGLKKCFNPITNVSTCVWAGQNMKCLWDNNYVTRKN